MYSSSSQTVGFANCGFQDTRYIWYCYNVLILSSKCKIVRTVVMDISVLRGFMYSNERYGTVLHSEYCQ